MIRFSWRLSCASLLCGHVRGREDPDSSSKVFRPWCREVRLCQVVPALPAAQGAGSPAALQRLVTACAYDSSGLHGQGLEGPGSEQMGEAFREVAENLRFLLL